MTAQRGMSSSKAPASPQHLPYPVANPTAHDAFPDPPSAPNKQGTAATGKKRKADPGSRSVKNLTPAQLQKKRANDCEAQRLKRQRTVDERKALKQRIYELENQPSNQEITNLKEALDQMRAENLKLKNSLDRIMQYVNAQSAGLKRESMIAEQSTSPYDFAGPEGQQSSLPQDMSHHQAHAYDDGQQENSRLDPNYSSFPAAAGSHSPHSYPRSDGSPKKHLRHPVLSHPQHNNNERPNRNYLLESSNQTNITSSSTPPNAGLYQLPRIQEQPHWNKITVVGPNSCPLDALLNDFHNSRRLMLQKGASKLEAIGPEYPSFAGLMTAMANQEALASDHPVSQLLIDILSKFPDISGTPERVAVLYIMFLIMRWLICPCWNCYDRLPDWCKPLQEQRDTPHAAWCDYLPWPCMRKRLCRSGSEVKFDDFFVPYTTTLSLNWSSPIDSVLAPSPDRPASLDITPAFLAHLRNLDNWSLGLEFRAAFPDLVDSSVRIRNA